MCLLALSISISAQIDLGILEVNTKNSVSLLFSSDVDIVLFGNNPEFVNEAGEVGYDFFSSFAYQNKLILKALTPQAEESSITVVTIGGDLFYGKIKYNEESDRLFYDFRQTKSKNKTVTASEDTGSPDADDLPKDSINNPYKAKLKYVMNSPKEYNNFGVVYSKVIYSITNIMNDEKNMYLKLIIKNTSGNTFDVGSVVFKHVEGKTKGMKKNQVKNEERMMPLYEISQPKVKAYSAEQFGYVLPLFTTGDKGSFVVQFIEQNGTRNFQIVISAKDMLKIKNFD
jgi:hypothetical protein